MFNKFNFEIHFENKLKRKNALHLVKNVYESYDRSYERIYFSH